MGFEGFWHWGVSRRARGVSRRDASQVKLQPVTKRGLAFETLENRCLLSATADLDITNLNSLPGSNNVIYLDFDGHTTLGTEWNRTYSDGEEITTPRYALDGNTTKTYFDDVEKAAIYEIWQRVSEDYAPFNVNVTTVEPAAEVFTAGRAIRICVGGSNKSVPDQSGAGVGYVGSFSWENDTPCFVFSDDCLSVKYTAETITHEAGHTLGIDKHDGITTTAGRYEYYSGANGWAPIMGTAGDSIPLSQWSKGEYAGATDTKTDDLAVLEETFRVQGGYESGYRVVASASDFTEATSLDITAGQGMASSIILTSDSVDYYAFSNDGRALDFWVGGVVGITNLDALVTIYSQSDTATALSVYDPQDTLYTEFTFSETGDFYLTVEGTGKTVDGLVWWTDYGSIGTYDIFVGTPDVLTVTTTEDAIGSAGLSLREAVVLAKERTQIVFDSTLAGQTITVIRAFDLDKSVWIDGSSIYNSETDTPGMTICLDGRYSGRLLNLHENANVTLTKLTLENGYLTSDVGYTDFYERESNTIWTLGGGSGGAIFVFKSHLQLDDCLIQECYTSSNGGAIVNQYGNVEINGGMIRNCTSASSAGAIYNNQGILNLKGLTITQCEAGANGGGINNLEGEVALTNCVLSDNTADTKGGGYSGGAIFLERGKLTIDQSRFLGNSAYSGGAIGVPEGTLEVRNSAFWNNTSRNTGGAITAYSADKDSVLTLINVTIAGNISEYGGGLCLGTKTELTLVNSILTENHSTHSSNYDNLYDNQVEGSIRLNNLIGDEAGFVCGPVFGTDGLLTNADEIDLHLTETSPACDAGNNGYVTTEYDLDGNARIAAKGTGEEGTVDLGAWEYTPNTEPEKSAEPLAFCLSTDRILFSNEQIIKIRLTASFFEPTEILFWRIYWGESNQTGEEIVDQKNICSNDFYATHYYLNTTPQWFSIRVEIVDQNYQGFEWLYYVGSLYLTGAKNLALAAAALPESCAGGTDLATNVMQSEARQTVFETLPVTALDASIDELGGEIAVERTSSASLPVAVRGMTSEAEETRTMGFRHALRSFYADYCQKRDAKRPLWGDWWALTASEAYDEPIRIDLGVE
ncbi:MAG: hypothetical protein Q4G68_07465 [Planctomycetia bacterium]|nr:hypothetical protein [Planctomycetia bacterium]